MRDPYTFINHSSAPKPVLDTIAALLTSWDMPRTDYQYVSMFKPDGVLHVLAEPAKGENELKKLHDDMINPDKGPVVDLQHYLDRIFVMSGGNTTKTEVIYTGTLTNVLVDGQKIVTDYATWMIMSECEQNRGEMRVEYLKVYSDTSQLASAIAKILGKAGEQRA